MSAHQSPAATPAPAIAAAPADMLDKPLSPALENYLAIIFRLEFADGACRASDIADAAHVARPSVTSALRMLSRLGYVRYSPYKLINLTDKGVKAGQKLAHRKLVLHDFFHNILQLPKDISETTACELEHVVPDEALLRLRQFLLTLHHHEDRWRHWREEYAQLAATLPPHHHAHSAGFPLPQSVQTPMAQWRAGTPGIADPATPPAAPKAPPKAQPQGSPQAAHNEE